MRQLVVSASPHLRSSLTIERIMWSVVIALTPAFLGSVYFFGIRAIVLVFLSMLSAIIFEGIFQKAFGRKITFFDGSAAVTGMLLAFSLPPGVPFWMPVVGSFFAIFVAKQLFGGLGYNFVNPALAARAFLTVSWPSLMATGFIVPNYGTLSSFDAVTQATPLSAIKNALPSEAADIITKASSWQSLLNQFMGNIGGCLGETSALLLLVGAVYLLIKGLIDYRIPLSYLATTFFLSLLILPIKTFPNYHIFQLITGGLILGAFFMATDYVTSPVTPKGRVIFGVGCGVLTMLIRHFGGYPEGVTYAILLMNLATPFIEKYTKPRVFGT